MKSHVVRHWTIPAFTVCIAIAVGGMTLAQHAGKGQVKVTQLSQRDIIEKLDGKDARATVEVVTFQPGEKDSAHRHTGPVVGYVLEGEYEHALNDEPIKIYGPSGISVGDRIEICHDRATASRALRAMRGASGAPGPRVSLAT